MKNITIANFWTYCLIFIQVFGGPVFETVQSSIANCNPTVFKMICFTVCFAVITSLESKY